MGKLTLLLVVAATLGGAYLTLSMQGLLGEGALKHSGEQADLLAREIAESGHDLILSSMMGSDGFRTPSSGSLEGDLDGGRYAVAVSDTDLPQRAMLTARGMYGGAEHVITSEHEFDAMEYPGPIWIDVPYATVESEPDARVTGGSDGPGIRFDRRQNDQYRLNSFLPASEVEANLRALATDTGTNYKSTGNAGSAPAQWAGLLDDLNVRDAEELYQAAVENVTETKTGPVTVRGNRTWGANDPTAVTLVTGSLSIPNGGKLSGTGALVVDGPLVVKGSGELNWVGLVIVHSKANVLPVQLDGAAARITGALVIAQRSFPPGGHLDVTVNRSPNGAGMPIGNRTGAPAEWSAPGFTWFQHNHQFDIEPATAPRGRRVQFVQGGGAGPHETEVRFHDLLAGLGSTPVYLQFKNETRHGFAQFILDVDGMPDAPLTGSARNGFDTFAFRSGTGADRFRTAVFDADDLNDFSVEVMALRSLQPRFDGVGSCVGDEWPFCVGEDLNRAGAFSVQLKKAAGGATLYNAALYWHMRADEVAEHEAEEQVWRDEIAAGAGYGTHLKLGDGTRVAYNRAVILQLADRLGFDGNQIIKRNLTHQTLSANAAPTAGAGPAPGLTPVCHLADNTTRWLEGGALAEHLAHGDAGGECAAAGRVNICNKPGRNGIWRDREIDAEDLSNHIAHGCRSGTCASNGLPTAGGSDFGGSGSSGSGG